MALNVPGIRQWWREREAGEAGERKDFPQRATGEAGNDVMRPVL